MPTYQYRCRSCGHDLEAVQKFSDPALTTCPECGGDLRKVYGNVEVVFKGSGFYKTDSRKAEAKNGAVKKSDSKPEPAKAEASNSSSSKSSEAKTSSSSDSKSTSVAKK